jgi:ribosomal-protein-alanine N-acetyltransferase
MVRVSITPMRTGDLDAVIAIDARTAAHPWPPGAFLHELEVNPLARYFVARFDPSTLSRPAWMARLRDGRTPSRSPIVGFGGLWMQVDEAHVSRIAVDPGYRRRHIGERLLVRLFQHALDQRAALMTLEVGASNHAAQQLYIKYGFAIVGQRRDYYGATAEDALIMTTPPLADPDWRAQFAQLCAALGERSLDGPDQP